MAALQSEKSSDPGLVAGSVENHVPGPTIRPPSPLGATPRPPLMRDRQGLTKSAARGTGTARQEPGGNHDMSSEKVDSRSEDSQEESSKNFTILAFIFVASLVVLGLVYWNFPDLKEEERAAVKLPRNIEDAKALGRVLSAYKEAYYYEVMAGVTVTYIFLQTFAIPGSIFLSILIGYMFPFPLALFVVCLCSATGASFCYLLSYLVGRRLVLRYIPDRVKQWSATVNRHRDNLLWYIIFLRITPFLPNWFINITSPVIDVPLYPFYLGTFLGVAPPSCIAIQTGTTLYQLTHYGAAVSWKSMSFLAVFAVLSLLPTLFKGKLKEKFD
ncbi:TMEM41B [Branchiostoma lanceolatum]|uniref:Transmembrane protein 41B n=1 Tax=Branchiostoma lanceolatum TaxID=7740 RepID=A0A8J9ZQK4_BRALA|nr:TMEM41B [Branchiostoma lanceolatum]